MGFSEREEKNLPHPIQNETANKSHRLPQVRSPSRVQQPIQDKGGWRKEPVQKSKKTMMSSPASTNLLPSAAAASLLPRRVSPRLCFAGTGAVASRRRGSRLAVVRAASAEAPAYTSDSLILYFKAEGTMEERAIPKITESLEAMEGVKDLEVLIEEGIASVVLTKETTVQATGVASNLVEAIQGAGFKLQTLSLSFDDFDETSAAIAATGGGDDQSSV
ncbi:hypothetical protein EJB05_34963, partial [Eragrostis curvula]